MALNPKFKNSLILIKGAGDLASGIAYRLKRSGFPLMMTELATPTMVRRAVSFGDVVYNYETTIEGVQARRAASTDEALMLSLSDIIPVIVDTDGSSVQSYQPQILVDAIMAKKNTGTKLQDAPYVIALGPGFVAQKDCHAVIETKRGHNLGRVLYYGEAEPNTGIPGEVRGHTDNRVLRAPTNGQVKPYVAIGDIIKKGQLIATVDGQAVQAPFDGVLRGLVHQNVTVQTGFKIGDLDPRGNIEHCFTISDKALAIGGGVLEAILAYETKRSNSE